MSKDFSFLQQVFWAFWHAKQAPMLSFDPDNIRQRVETLGMSYECFQDRFITPYSGRSIKQLEEILTIQSTWINHGRFKFVIQPTTDLLALDWTFVQVVHLGLPGLDLFSPFSKEDKQDYCLPYQQCWLCGNKLVGSHSKFCHWPQPGGCDVTTRSSGSHIRADSQHCCFAKMDNRKRSVRQTLNSTKKAKKNFSAFLERLYKENQNIQHSIHSRKNESYFQICDIAQENKPPN